MIMQEHDHDLTLSDLAVKVLGLVHMHRLYIEIGCYDDEIADDLNHAAMILAERVRIEEM
jgi:hypothetical protein